MRDRARDGILSETQIEEGELGSRTREESTGLMSRLWKGGEVGQPTGTGTLRSSLLIKEE